MRNKVREELEEGNERKEVERMIYRQRWGYECQQGERYRDMECGKKNQEKELYRKEGNKANVRGKEGRKREKDQEDKITGGERQGVRKEGKGDEKRPEEE